SHILGQDWSGSASLELLWRATDDRFLFIFGSTTSEIITSTHQFPTGSFYLVNGTYDGATFKLYVNGNLEGQFAEAKSMAYTAIPWTIGASSSGFRPGFARTWNGVIDEAQVFNRALAQSEIQALYAAGSAGECKPSAFPILKPISYAMPNGQSGSFHYWDDTYNGSGSHTTDGAALSGGVGQLTDGYVGGQDWGSDLGRGPAYEWVGWFTLPQPITITFDFGATQTFHTISFHCDNDEQGGVFLFGSVILDFSNDGVTFSNAVTYTTTAADRSNLVARFIPVSIPGTTGRYVRARLTSQSGAWMFISEIQFQ
ncbi:MAG TPA: LamG domain-containing protein, partial [Candidatus Sulfopaludibacter sp.]|nr:LamG domain-containing protein [Candidatus Sulfopaludibacter sp.]